MLQLVLTDMRREMIEFVVQQCRQERAFTMKVAMTVAHRPHTIDRIVQNVK